MKPKLSSTISVVKISDSILEFFKTNTRQQLRIKVEDDAIMNIVLSLDGSKTVEEIAIEHDVKKQDLDKLEVFYINKYNSTNSAIGYNIALGAVGGDTYSNLSESDKQARDKKLSSSLKSSYIKKVCINKDDVDLRIKETDLQKYLDEGWKVVMVTPKSNYNEYIIEKEVKDSEVEE